MDHVTKTSVGTMADPASELLPEGEDSSPAVATVMSLTVDHSGTTIHLQVWPSQVGKGRPPVVVVHDLGEQSDDYQEFAAEMVRHGWSVYAFDLRGHGRSGRRLGHAPSFQMLVKDLLQVAAWVRHLESGLAPIIIGQGIGALIVMEFTKTYGQFCRAAILSAPCLELVTPVPWAFQLVLKFTAEILPTLRYPRLLTPAFARPALPPSKRLNDEAYGTARLSFFPRLTAIFAYELLRAVRRAEARFIEYHGSVLILCPDQDGICSYHQLKRFAALHKEHNLEIVDLKASGHGVFTESAQSRDHAIDVLLPWMARVLRPPAPELKVSDAEGPPAPHAAGAMELRISGAARALAATAPIDDLDKPGATKS